MGGEGEEGGCFVVKIMVYSETIDDFLVYKTLLCLFLILRALATGEPEMTKFGYVTPPYKPCEAFMCGLLAERPGWKYLYDYEIKSGSGLERSFSPQLSAIIWVEINLGVAWERG